MANWTGPVQLGCCAPCPPGFIWNSPLPEISLELLVHKNEMKYPRRARIFALFLNIRQFLKESPWGLAWCRCNILMNYIWKALIPEVLLVWFGPSPNPLSSSVAPKLLVVPCPLLSKVSWGCWATGRIKKKNVLLVCFCGCSALGTWSGSTAWWLELKPELSRKTYKQKHHSYTRFSNQIWSDLMMKEEHPIAKSLNHLSLKYLLIQKINPTLAIEKKYMNSKSRNSTDNILWYQCNKIIN